jgi:SAM-dependent methyltransferase
VKTQSEPPVDSDLWDLHELARARRLCDYMFAQIPVRADDRVLEVGAGIGTFSERLLGAGASELMLVEPEASCAAELRARFGADTRVHVHAELLPDAPSLAGRDGEFDLALSQNVLEHIEDDSAATVAMARALRPGGRLVALVPAHPRLYGPLDRGFGHYRRYTRERLEMLADSAGLEIERIHSFNALGILGWIARNRTGGGGVGGAPLRVYELLLAGWRPVEERLNLPVGLSLILRARKPGGEQLDG